jgi:hypothetical protein
MDTVISKALGLPPLPLTVVTHSSLTDKALCNMRYIFKHVFGLRVRGATECQHIGTLYHQAIASEITGVPWEYDPETQSQDAAKVRAMVRVVRESGALNFAGCKVTAIESRMVIPFSTGLVGGTMDFVLRHRESGALIIPDWKTCDEPTDWLTKARTSMQTALYAWLVSTVQGISVSHTCHIGVRRPKIVWKLNRKVPQTLADYEEDCYEWLTGTGRHAKTWSDARKLNPSVAHSVVYRSLQDSFDEVKALAAELLSFHAAYCKNEPEAFTQLSTARTGQLTGTCQNCYGRRCEFWDLCYEDRINWHHTAKRFDIAAHADEYLDTYSTQTGAAQG